MNTVRRATAHTFLALLEGLLIASMLVLLVAVAALAGKPRGGWGGKPHGGGTTSGAGTVAMVVAVDNGAAGANWNDSVTYAVSTTATQYPYVSTQCTQNRTLVLSTSAGFFPSYAWPSAQVVPLTTDRWTGGAADCTAKLYSMDGGSQATLATITFHVGG